MTEAKLTIDVVDVDDLVPDPTNARAHGPKNLEAIKASLRRFGLQKPIVVDAENRVLAGNGTLEGARALGWKKIAVVRSPLTDDEATAYAIVDNKTSDLSSFDPDLLRAQIDALGDDKTVFFYDLDLRKLLADAGKPPDDFPELDEDSVEITTTCPRCGHQWS